MLQSEVDGGRATGIVAGGDDLLQRQGLHDRFQIPKLLFKAVVSAFGFVRRAEAQEVYRDGSATGLRQVRNEVVIECVSCPEIRGAARRLARCRESRGCTGCRDRAELDVR